MGMSPRKQETARVRETRAPRGAPPRKVPAGVEKLVCSWDGGWEAQKISTSTRTLVNSVYHGRYFDSIYPCEVRGHSPEIGKARNTKGGSLFAGAVSLAVLFHIMNHSSSMSAASVIIFVLFSPAALVATRFIGRYHCTRQLVTSHTRDSFRQENAFLISTSILP